MTDLPNNNIYDSVPANNAITNQLFVQAEDVIIVKEEPAEETNQSIWAFNSGEVVNLLTDDEGDDLDVTGSRPRPEGQLRSTLRANGGPTHKKKQSNVNIAMTREMIMEKQREIARRFRDKKQPSAISEFQKAPNTDGSAKMIGTLPYQDRGGKQGQDPVAAQFGKLKRPFQKFMMAESAEATRLRLLQAEKRESPRKERRVTAAARLKELDKKLKKEMKSHMRRLRSIEELLRLSDLRQERFEAWCEWETSCRED